MGFTESDLRRVDEGQIVARSLELDDNREIAVLSLARLAAPARSVIPHLQRAEIYASSSAAPDAGRFSTPARLEDLGSLNFPRSDIKDLADCRVGACEIKLSERMIGRFQNAIDWNSPEHIEQVSALTREMLLEYVRAYRSGGDGALGLYADKPEPLSIADGFEALLANADLLKDFFPDLHAYLSNYPEQEPAGAQEFMYWLREEFGLKPVVSLYHAAVHAPSGDDGPSAAVALKQLYASHYFQAALNVIAVMDSEGDTGTPGSYVVFTRHARFDGPLTGFGRMLVRVRLQDGGTETLNRLRARAEGDYGAGQAESRHD